MTTSILRAASALTASLAALALPAAALAETAAMQGSSQQIASGPSKQDEFARFTPRPTGAKMSLDYGFWDDALKFFVMSMGPSTRQGERKPDASLGTRLTYGHDSRTRLEGNRVVFSFLKDDQITPLSEYRADLEQIASEIDIASLSRNEQLAFWINLHNVAVTEMIGLNYPLKAPSRMKLGPDRTPLDETRFINVAGVMMSPRDIRTRIVYPNWKDPMVIYGFFRGDIGGPSIRKSAYTGANVGEQLAYSANEFVNSLRGVEAWGGSLLVSRIYEEAAPYYFPNFETDLKAHLAAHAEEEVTRLLATNDKVKYNEYEIDIADLAGGQREPSYGFVQRDGEFDGTRVTPSIARLLGERSEKFEKLRREGKLGRVIVLPENFGSSDQPLPEGTVTVLPPEAEADPEID